MRVINCVYCGRAECICRGALLKNSPRIKAVFARFAQERLRQQRLFAEGRIKFNVASPVTNNDRRLRVATEELGEVARAIDCIENADPTNKAAWRLHLQDELIQLGAVVTAWLESMERIKRSQPS